MDVTQNKENIVNLEFMNTIGFQSAPRELVLVSVEKISGFCSGVTGKSKNLKHP